MSITATTPKGATGGRPDRVPRYPVSALAVRRRIDRFFVHADTDYLTTKLGINPTLKQRKKDLAYVARIVDAVKEALRPVPGIYMPVKFGEPLISRLDDPEHRFRPVGEEV